MSGAHANPIGSTGKGAGRGPVLWAKGLVVETAGAGGASDADSPQELRSEGRRVVELPELALPEGAVGALLGPSGCGKSSLLRALGGHVLPRGMQLLGGERHVFGGPAPAPGTSDARGLLRGPVTWLPQDAHNVLDPVRRLGPQLVDLAGGDVGGLHGAAHVLGLQSPQLGPMLKRYPHQVSGGEAERLLLAAGLARYRHGPPGVLLADEPTACLDGAAADAVLGQLRKHAAQPGCAVLMATHEPKAVAALGATVWNAQSSADGHVRFVPSVAPPKEWPDWRGQGRGASAAGPSRAGSVLLTASNVHLQLGGRTVLNGASLAVHGGEVVVLAGSSGAGKSTFARVLAGLALPDAGAVVRGADSPRSRRGSNRRQQVQLVFQNAKGSMTPRRTLRGLVAETAVPGFDLDATAFMLQLPKGVLDRTGIQLSGGEARRAALLRALSVQPRVLILDEPTAGLDRETAIQMTDLLHRLQQREDLAILAITHDRGWAQAFGDRVMSMVDGKVVG